jgi:hypothetical protein
MITSKLFYRCTYADHQTQAANFKQSHFVPCDPTVTTFVDSTPIVVQVEASEGTHLSLENDPAWHTMALLVAGSTLCAACVTALAAYGIVSTDTMWLASKKLAAVHPELRATRF